MARGEAWEKSDIDLMIIMSDGEDRGPTSRWLTEDGVNISAYITTRAKFKRGMESVLQGSVEHSIHTQSVLLFSVDETIERWFEGIEPMGERDQELQLLKTAVCVTPNLDKAEKWFYVKRDLRYSFVWTLYAVNQLARVEVVLNGEIPGREVIHQALQLNPTFFNAVYTDLIDGPKDGAAIQGALDAIKAYLGERAERLYAPVLDYLSEAEGLRTASELEAHFRKKLGSADLLWACEWLTRQGILEKASSPVRLTRRSQVALEEPAFYYDGDPSDWE
jgi:hypothetical protein